MGRIKRIPAVIFDIDNTILYHTNRSPFDWSDLSGDTLIEGMHNLICMYYDYDYKDYDNCVDTKFYDNCTNDMFSGYDTYGFKETSILNYMHSLNDSELQSLLPLTLQGTKHLSDLDYDDIMYFYDSKIDVYYEYDIISDTVSTLGVG